MLNCDFTMSFYTINLQKYESARQICKQKSADQLHGDCAADQRICFRCIDSTTPLLPLSEISSPLPFSVVVQPGLCQTCSKTSKTGFLATRLNCNVRYTTQNLISIKI